MKLSKIILFFALFLSFCASSEAQKVKNIQMQSNSRGYQEKIFITRNKVHLVRISPQGKIDTTFSLSQKDWAQLNKLVKGINLNNISVVKSPTDYHKSDRAHATTLTINTSDNQTYTSSTFDDYNAPKDLKPVMDKIMVYLAKAKK